MKIPYGASCAECGSPAVVNVSLSDNQFIWKCKCGWSNDVHVGAEFSIGWRLLTRSEYEIEENEDYSMAIVLAAMAFDCELSQLFFKWKSIAADATGKPADGQALEDELRSLGNVELRIKNIAILLDPRGFGGFLRSMPNINSYVHEHFPHVHVDTAEKDFQEELFWPRNRILHQGFTHYTKEDAKRCWQMASLGLMVLFEMDAARRQQNG